MSTNFYVSWRVSDAITMTLHVGTTTHGGFSMLSGKVFPTRDAWVGFLEHNRYSIELRDEYGNVHDLDKFINNYLLDSSPTASGAMMERLGALVRKAPLPTGANVTPVYWRDGAFLFYGGDFS